MNLPGFASCHWITLISTSFRHLANDDVSIEWLRLPISTRNQSGLNSFGLRNMHRDSAQLIQILSDLRSGRLDCVQAHTRMESQPGFQFPNSELVLSYLEHYLDDEDIRRRDLHYARMQNGELDKLVSRLQQSDYEGAAKVNFLDVA